jgi:ketosteroid isomerase-like protein
MIHLLECIFEDASQKMHRLGVKEHQPLLEDPMSRVLQPEEINKRWAEAFNAADIPSMLDLYEPDAVLIPSPGAAPITGHDAIRTALTWLVGLGGTITFQPRYWLRHGDIAMGSIAFRLQSATDPAGHPVDLHGRSTEVIHRQPDGTWKYLIDHPFGAST